MSLDIRPMSRADLEHALGWAKAEGWNPGLDDAAAFHAQDSAGFLMGWLGGEPVGCISVVKYGERFAFLGLYIVRPEFRGRGLGKVIWEAGIASASGRTIGLDGVPAQQENYRRSGFRFAHRNARWGGVPGRLPAVPANVRAVEGVGPVLETYDALHFPAPRSAFLEAWLAPTPTRKSCVWAGADGSVLGYGTIRKCHESWKVGPLFAETPATAEGLLAGLVRESQADRIFIDVPEANGPAAALATRLGLTPEFETARMYLGPAPTLPLERIFGLTTLELG